MRKGPAWESVIFKTGGQVSERIHMQAGTRLTWVFHPIGIAHLDPARWPGAWWRVFRGGEQAGAEWLLYVASASCVGRFFDQL